MKPGSQPTISRLRRLCYAAFAATFVSLVAGWVAPSPASAHGDHTCTATTSIPSSGWACRRVAVLGSIAGVPVDIRQIFFYYDGTRRGGFQLNMYRGTNDVHSIFVCDSETIADNIRPRLGIDPAVGSNREFAAPNRDCSEYPGSQVNVEVIRYRGLTRTNTSAAALQHASIWYPPYID
jgi:hypothetical protein